MYKTFIAQLHQVLSVHLESPALGGRAHCCLSIQGVSVKQDLFPECLPEIGDIAVFFDDVMATNISERESSMHHKIDGSNSGVLLVQLIALLDLHDLALVEYHLEYIER